MYDLSIKKDDEKTGWLYLGIPVEDFKDRFQLLRFATDEEYYDQNINDLLNIIIREAEMKTNFTYSEASLFGFLEGKVWIHCKVNKPIDVKCRIHDLIN